MHFFKLELLSQPNSNLNHNSNLNTTKKLGDHQNTTNPPPQTWNNEKSKVAILYEPQLHLLDRQNEVKKSKLTPKYVKIENV